MSETRVAVVTGAANGIGRSVALRLARDGFDVCVNDIPANEGKLKELVEEISKLGRKSIIFLADISVEAQVQSMVQQTVADLGRLDVVRKRPISFWMHYYKHSLSSIYFVDDC
jgi:NAD(P)-dependent dehydrogenase (short-subunit alcohol dehydrogenase family)